MLHLKQVLLYYYCPLINLYLFEYSTTKTSRHNVYLNTIKYLYNSIYTTLSFMIEYEITFIDCGKSFWETFVDLSGFFISMQFIKCKVCKLRKGRLNCFLTVRNSKKKSVALTSWNLVFEKCDNKKWNQQLFEKFNFTLQLYSIIETWIVNNSTQ